MTESLGKQVAFLFVAIIVSVPAVGHAQPRPFGSVDGRVRIAGEDVGMISVQLQHLGMTIQEQFSADGRFSFWNVPYGPYTLSIRVPGRDPLSQDISVPGESHVMIDIGTRTKLRAGATTSVFELQIPRSARRQYERGRDQLRKGDCPEALKHFAEAVRLFANYADAYNAVGNCHVLLQHPALAEEAFKKSVELTPSVYPALNLADVYIKQGRLEEAEAVLTRALSRNPAHGDAYYGLALL